MIKCASSCTLISKVRSVGRIINMIFFYNIDVIDNNCTQANKVPGQLHFGNDSQYKTYAILWKTPVHMLTYLFSSSKYLNYLEWTGNDWNTRFRVRIGGKMHTWFSRSRITLNLKIDPTITYCLISPLLCICLLY